MTKIKILGDPHLGRQFVHGVPLHRRGEREALVKAAFAAEYAGLNKQFDVHVMMGDLFDKAIVPYDIILFAANVLNKAAMENPDTKFVVLKGNHDWLRDLERSSAFDMFARLVHHDNVIIVNKVTRIKELVFFAYDPLTPTAEVVEKTDLSHVTKVFGHWDTNGFGSEHNVVPTRLLSSKGIGIAYTGHVHKPALLKRDGVDVHVVGSMQPFAFGEQADDSTFYLDLTLDEAKARTDLADKVVRITLQAHEDLEDNIECLQLVLRRITVAGDEATTVTMESFDMETLFRKAFTDVGVRNDILEKLLGRYNDSRLSAHD